MERNKYQKIIAEVLGTKQIAFNPDLARALGSANAGILLSQLLYWHKKGADKDWIYKTIDEMQTETSLSRAEQDTAIKICKKFNILEVKLKGIPAKRHFNLDIPKIAELLETALSKNDNQVCKYPTNLAAGFKQSNSEITAENTNKDSVSTRGAKINEKRKEKGIPKPYFRGKLFEGEARKNFPGGECWKEIEWQ
jgi:hypothetical protein